MGTREEGANILTLGPDDVPTVVDVLSEAFFDYPAMRFVLGEEGASYEHRLRTLIHFFVMARVFRNEFLFGTRHLSDLGGVALLSRPTVSRSPAPLAELRERVWTALGEAARTRYEAFGAACRPFAPDLPHLHLNMIGIRPGARGRGLGRRLLDHVHMLSRNDPDSRGVSLNTEDGANLALYEHLGYQRVGHATLAGGLDTWGFFRPD
jgi:ribosomal protein S18 acetylase RimI-like enzyme